MLQHRFPCVHGSLGIPTASMGSPLLFHHFSASPGPTVPDYWGQTIGPISEPNGLYQRVALSWTFCVNATLPKGLLAEDLPQSQPEGVHVHL